MKIEIILKQSLARAIQYQEKHVGHGRTQCIHTDAFPKSKSAIGALHIVITIDRKHVFDNSMLEQIACDYMKEINLQDQPFRAYFHKAWNSHIHIVTANSSLHSKIPQHYHAKSIIHRLEKKYLLTPSDLPISEFEWKFLRSDQIVYGKTIFHTTFNTILSQIVGHYNYRSIEGLNKLLNLFKMSVAVEDNNSTNPSQKELIYSRLNADGKRNHLQIKSSELARHNDWDYIRPRMEISKTHTWFDTRYFPGDIDRMFELTPLTFSDFQKKIEHWGMLIVVQHDNKGRPKDIMYIKPGSHAFIEGSELGDKYTVDGINSRCVPEGTYSKKQRLQYLNTWRIRK